MAWELSQFSRIHDNVDIPDEDKFQYLIQVTLKGLRAQEVVDSFPPTAANYSKVIDSLKSMFRQELLLTYVRELLVLVVKNTTSMKGGLNTLQLYDKLESYFRALESIGMTADKYTAMLFPLVESCIPEEHVKSFFLLLIKRYNLYKVLALMLRVYILEFILLSCLKET